MICFNSVSSFGFISKLSNMLRAAARRVRMNFLAQGIASLMNESIRVHFSDSAGHAKCIYHLSQPYPEYKDLNFSRNLLASFSEIFFWCLSTLVRLLWPNMNGPYA